VFFGKIEKILLRNIHRFQKVNWNRWTWMD